MLYFNHKKCTRYFKSFILNLFEIEILNDESLYNMCRVFSCLFAGSCSQISSPCLASPSPDIACRTPAATLRPQSKKETIPDSNLKPDTVSLFLTFKLFSDRAVMLSLPASLNRQPVAYTFLTFLRISQKSNVAK